MKINAVLNEDFTKLDISVNAGEFLIQESHNDITEQQVIPLIKDFVARVRSQVYIEVPYGKGTTQMKFGAGAYE